MKVEFVVLQTLFGTKTISRNAIALIEPQPSGCKVTLHTKDENDKHIVILSGNDYAGLIELLSRKDD